MEITEPAVIRPFEDVECWKHCRSLRLFVAKQSVPVLPKDERYRLGDQLLRAARSTTANIAEGYGRFHSLDNAKFCSNARSSCWEVLDHLITGYDEELVSHELMMKGRDFVAAAIRLLNGYMRYLRQAKPNNE